MIPTQIGIKQFHKDLSKITRAVMRGHSFLILKHATPVFNVTPASPPAPKKYTLQDLFSIRFKSGDKNLSKKIDKIVYGI